MYRQEAEITIASAKSRLSQIITMLEQQSWDWRSYIASARYVCQQIESSGIMADKNRLEEQLWLIGGLQRFSYFEPDSGAVSDIACWCETQWHTLLSNHPQNVEVLRGLGYSWLMRAQPGLSRIHADEASYAQQDEDTEAAEAEARRATQVYVEARALLIPATDFLQRAVSVASERNALTGELLTLTAEAYMSLGNVSFAANSERLFIHAVNLLRRAAAVPGYSLPNHMRRWMREYERLLA